MTGTAWTADMVGGIAAAPLPELPPVAERDVVRIVPGLDLWDLWPVQLPDGSVAAVAGGELWMALSAPALGDPVDRHAMGRIRLLWSGIGEWRDLGFALPKGFGPGSREWSGSAVLDGDRLTLFYTAAGRIGEAAPTFEQRLFQATATLAVESGRPRLSSWSALHESVASDGSIYVRADQAEGQVGTIKAFRDPAWFRDPADGIAHLLFAASLGGSASAFNGAVGLARADRAGTWSLLPPLVHADRLNNELERPHLIYRDGRYHLFWSTQASVFAPDGPRGPTGLYGMVADRLHGPYRPLNGTGLVLANPPAAPMQAYSWLVLDDLRVISFIDYWGLAGPPADAAQARAHFGGAPAPVYRLTIDGDRAR